MSTMMRRIVFAAVVICCGAGPMRAAPSRPLESRLLKKTALTFPDGKTIRADVVDTPDLRETGLMFRRGLLQDYGMLFVFSDEGTMEFWMKNTLVSLDIIFIDQHKKITEVYKQVKESTRDTPESKVARVGGRAQYVLELPAGAAARHHLKVGQTLNFAAEIPER